MSAPYTQVLKGLIFKKSSAPVKAEEAQSQPIKDSENPYLTARRTWNEHVGSVVSSRQTWQVVGILSLLIALASVGGMIQIGSMSKFIPYLVEVDKFGRTASAGPVQQASKADPKIIGAAVSKFIEDARLVTPDIAIQRKAVFNVYAHLSPNDPATTKMNEWMNGSEDSSPFVRAAKEMVSIEITSVLSQSPDTWQVEWEEITRDRQGEKKGLPERMRALLTVYTAEPTEQTTEDQLLKNPLLIYVRDYSWSRLQ
ncbi:conjugal transfer protein TrbF [Hahella ganghwensis]|uniref:conjugal transfer protein TrbF n=1 Tax=Hahella ganghwensis TaxID=286420 RepID=UPI00036EF8A8|nr:conjugal transfer protein TrbF [Hahella ganghwensis]